MKNLTHRPCHSPEPREDVVEQSISSPKGVFETKLQKIRKPQINRKWVIICEIPAPVSPASKKRRAHELVKMIKKKAKALEDPLDEVVFETDLEGNDSPVLQSKF